MEKFSPFVLYVDGVLGKEDLVVIADLIGLMSVKIE